MIGPFLKLNMERQRYKRFSIEDAYFGDLKTDTAIEKMFEEKISEWVKTNGISDFSIINAETHIIPSMNLGLMNDMGGSVLYVWHLTYSG